MNHVYCHYLWSLSLVMVLIHGGINSCCQSWYAYVQYLLSYTSTQVSVTDTLRLLLATIGYYYSSVR